MTVNSKSSNLLVIRADAGNLIGTGHIMRGIAIGQAWREHTGGQVVFLCAELPIQVKERLLTEGFEIEGLQAEIGQAEDARLTRRYVDERCAAAIVIDGYSFGVEYQKALRGTGARMLVVDDAEFCDAYCADIVLNHVPSPDFGKVKFSEQQCTFLLGARYAMLRDEFMKKRPMQRKCGVKRILVTMGGSDPCSVTPKVLRGLSMLKDENVSISVVVGVAAECGAEVDSIIDNSTHLTERIDSSQDMALIMASADVAVSACGSTAWELAYMGLPAAVVITADNQRNLDAGLSKFGVVTSLGWHAGVTEEQVADVVGELLHDEKKRVLMINAGKSLVDGNGRDRIAMHLRGMNFFLREADERDCRDVWLLSSDPEVRKASFSNRQILWEEHIKWFECQINNAEMVFYVAIDGEDRFVGQVRFAVDKSEATISASIVREQRGKGFGVKMVKEATWRLMREHSVKAVHALIRAENEASMGTFLAAGYTREASCNVDGHPAVAFRYV